MKGNTLKLAKTAKNRYFNHLEVLRVYVLTKIKSLQLTSCGILNNFKVWKEANSGPLNTFYII